MSWASWFVRCCDVDRNVQQAHAVQVRAFEETGKFEGSTGVALARTMFSLAKCFREMLESRSDSDGGPTRALSSTDRRPVAQDDMKLQAAVEHALTVCLYLRTTLLGVHVDTLSTYAEIADFFYTQRRYAFRHQCDCFCVLPCC